MAIIPKGQESANVKKRIDTLFPKLNEAYPNKVIVALQRDHKKWDETAREISKQLGYENKNDFLTAYGYKIEKLEGGRPSGDHMAIVDELKKRYPNGSPFTKLDELKAASPDLAPNFKTLANRATELFGMTFTKYLISEGVLANAPKEEKVSLSAEEKAEQRINKYKHQVDEVVTELKKRYPDSSKAPGTLDQLKSENSDLPIHNLTNWIQIAFEEKAITYLERERIVNTKNRQSQAVQKASASKPPKGVLEFKGRVFVATALEEWEKKEIEKVVISRGGIIRTSVSKNTDYLIINPNMQYPSPKFLTAKEWISKGVNIQIYAYDEFFEKVGLCGDKDLITEDFLINNGVLEKYIGKDNDVLIPDSVVEIGKRAFKECDHIVSVTIPSSTKIIGNNAFQYCSSLETVNFCGENLQSVGSSAFYGCVNLRKIILPNSVTEIGERSFVGCSSLSSITLSNKLQRIPFRTFRFLVGASEVFYCKFTDIDIPKSVTEIDGAAFECCISLKRINIPANVKQIEDGAFSGCSSLQKFLVDPNNEIYSSDIQGALFNKSKTTLIRVPQAYGKTYVVPNSVTEVNARAFNSCETLNSIVFLGDMPKFETEIWSDIVEHREVWKKFYKNFEGTKARIYYPKSNLTWLGIEQINFDGEILWIPYKNIDALQCLD